MYAKDHWIHDPSFTFVDIFEDSRAYNFLVEKNISTQMVIDLKTNVAMQQSSACTNCVHELHARNACTNCVHESTVVGVSMLIIV